jgi:hypothetical protein
MMPIFLQIPTNFERFLRECRINYWNEKNAVQGKYGRLIGGEMTVEILIVLVALTLLAIVALIIFSAVIILESLPPLLKWILGIVSVLAVFYVLGCYMF